MGQSRCRSRSSIPAVSDEAAEIFPERECTVAALFRFSESENRARRRSRDMRQGFGRAAFVCEIEDYRVRVSNRPNLGRIANR
jgi:hypothetical protein